MRPLVTIHAVLGPGQESATSSPGEISVLHLPGGTTTTRWISRGASRPKGMASDAEHILNSRERTSSHCVLDLLDPDLDQIVLTDELDPRWHRGLPRLSSVMGDLQVQIAELGAKGRFGTLVLDFPGDFEARRLRKVGAWCRQQGLRLALLGRTTDAVVGDWLSILAPGSTAKDLADLLEEAD